jgi:hypothetical protein
VEVSKPMVTTLFIYYSSNLSHHTPPDVVSIEGLLFEKVVENE